MQNTNNNLLDQNTSETNSNNIDFTIDDLANEDKRFFNYLIDIITIILVSYFINGFLPIHPMILFVLYFTFSEWLLSKTMGKFFTGTTVVTENGKSLSFLNSLGRTFCRLIPFEAFSCLFYKKANGWHDRLSKTIVVKDDVLKAKRTASVSLNN